MMRIMRTVGRIEGWQKSEGGAEQEHSMLEQEGVIPIRYVIKNNERCRRRYRRWDTWHASEEGKRGDRKSRNSGHYRKYKPPSKNNYDKTCGQKGIGLNAPSNSPNLIYLFSAPGNDRATVSLSCRLKIFFLILRTLCCQSCVLKIMAGEGSRNASTNRDLKRARETYETRTLQKEKQRIEELEAIVTEEEENFEAQELEKEMDWVQDPGTVTTRSTQYVRTQAEMWRMKTMLSKAISM